MSRRLLPLLSSCSRLGVLAALLVVGLSGPVPGAWAQQTGTITGTVTDDEQTSLPGAQVVVVGTQRGSTTDAAGQYRITGAPTGTIEVRASFVGYKARTTTVTLDAGETAQVDFTLLPDLLEMEEAVVTGAFNERTKLESSVAITTLNPEQIEAANPQGTADLLKTVPGFYVESSGGEGGNNVFARGIPADGSFRYITLQENGLPVFNSAELAFANIDQLYRVDETVNRMEAVRGGTGALFVSNAPAGYVNFVNKTGGQEVGGIVKLAGATRGKLRADFNLGGPFSDDWRFNAGGFYRYDEGVRNPGFPGNKGGQISANVTRFLENGYVRVYGRYLNDQNIFYLPIPLQNPDDPEGIDGFDPNYGTMTNRDAGLVRVPTPDGVGRVNRDLTRGVNPVVRSFQTDLVFDITDRLSLENKVRVMDANLVFNAIFSLSNPVPADLFAEQQVQDAGGNSLVQNFNYNYTYTDRAFDPADANGNGLIAETGWWHVDKPMRDFTNQFQLSYDAEAHSLNAGVYFTNYSMSELWHWHDILTDVQGNPRMLDLMVTDTQGNTVQVTENGFTQYGSTYLNHQATATKTAVYAGDEWQVTEQVRIDVGGRLEHAVFRGNTESGREVNLDNDPNTLYDNGVLVGSDSVQSYRYGFTEWALSGGVNYSISDRYAVFGRFTRGFRMPDFDQWAFSPGAKGNVEEVLQGELGVKVNTPNLGVFGTLFYSSLTNIPFTDEVVVGGDIVQQRRFANSLSPGLEVEVQSQYGNFSGNLTATLQRPRYRDFEFTQDTDGDGTLESFDFSDNRVRRIPRYVVTVNPRYDLQVASEVITAGLRARFYDERFTDDANNTTLPAYYVLDASLSSQLGPVRLKVSGSNLTNAIGLTEGNPRVGQVVGVEQDIYMARPILGRRFTASVAYAF